MSDDLTTFARRYRQEAAAALLTVIRDDTALASARTTAATKILEYADGRPGQARPVTVATLKDLSPDERFQIFQALIRYYAEDIGLDRLIQGVVDQVIEQSSRPKLTFRRGNPAPAPPPAVIVADNNAATLASHHEGSRSMQGSEQGLNARAASGWASPVDTGFSPDLDANTSRSERLAELAVQFLPRKKQSPPLAADSGDGYAHALRLSRLSADQLQDRYFGSLRYGDPSIWRGK